MEHKTQMMRMKKKNLVHSVMMKKRRRHRHQALQAEPTLLRIVKEEE
jgi:hypothetical protein